MNRLATVCTMVGLLAWSGCNGDSNGASSPSDAFAGKWSCSEHRTIEITTSNGANASDSTVMTTLDITSKNGVMTASNETDGSAVCAISFTVSGSVATLLAGQTCQSSDGITLSYKSGTSTLSGSSLNSTLAYDAQGTLPGGMPATGTGTTSSTCSRISGPPSSGGSTGGW